jgi:hypothetical protein
MSYLQKKSRKPRSKKSRKPRSKKSRKDGDIEVDELKYKIKTEIQNIDNLNLEIKNLEENIKNKCKKNWNTYLYKDKKKYTMIV